MTGRGSTARFPLWRREPWPAGFLFMLAWGGFRFLCNRIFSLKAAANGADPWVFYLTFAVVAFWSARRKRKVWRGYRDGFGAALLGHNAGAWTLTLIATGALPQNPWALVELKLHGWMVFGPAMLIALGAGLAGRFFKPEAGVTARSLGARFLMRLYPSRWRNEYGEEMRALLLSQPISVRVLRNVGYHALRENLRHPDRWRAIALPLVCWRSFWILCSPVEPLSPHALSDVLNADFIVFLATGFGAAWLIARREVSFLRGIESSLSALACGVLLPSLVVLLLDFGGLPARGIDEAVFERFSHIVLWQYVFVVSAIFWGALLGRYLRLESQ